MSDDPATAVYGRLLFRHMEAAREDFDGPRRAKLYDLIKAFRDEFPEECKVWDDRYDRAGDHAAISEATQKEEER